MGILDPQDPYWVLVRVSGQWYFADTCGIALMEDIPGTAEVELIRPITVPNVWIN